MNDSLQKIRKLATDAPEPATTTWLNLPNGEQSDSYYCEECAYRLVDYTGGSVIVPHPNHVVSDGGECCAICGALLNYSLSDYGLGSEMSHFESLDFMTPSSWREFEQVAESAICIERYEQRVSEFVQNMI